MKKPLFFIVIILVLLSSSFASADVINPEYFSKKCDYGETEITCSYTSNEPFGPKTYNGCARYENNPNFQLLTSTGSSFGGEVKYCFNPLTIEGIPSLVRFLLSPKSLLLLLITLLIEIPVFILIIRESRNNLPRLIIANLISIPIANIAIVYLPLNRSTSFLAVETLVILFEGLFITLTSQFDKGKIYKAVIIGNILSSTLGSLVAYVVPIFFGYFSDSFVPSNTSLPTPSPKL